MGRSLVTTGRMVMMRSNAIPARCDSLASQLYMLTVEPPSAGTSGVLPMSSAGLVGYDDALMLWTGTSAAAEAPTAVKL